MRRVWILVFFTFHNVSIKSQINREIIAQNCISLHSTMSLLNHTCHTRTGNITFCFTFHNVAIKSRKPCAMFGTGMSLHSTMSLLNQHKVMRYEAIIDTLHSTMSLLNHFQESFDDVLYYTLHSTMSLLNHTR